MQVLIGFLLIATVFGMFSRWFDWRAFFVFAAAAALVTGYYYTSTGAW